MLWSAQEEAQLIGRVHRQPQLKQVIVYKLVGMRTPDAIIDHISATKQMMHEAFLMKAIDLSTCSASCAGRC